MKSWRSERRRSKVWYNKRGSEVIVWLKGMVIIHMRRGLTKRGNGMRVVRFRN